MYCIQLHYQICIPDIVICHDVGENNLKGGGWMVGEMEMEVCHCRGQWRPHGSWHKTRGGLFMVGGCGTLIPKLCHHDGGGKKRWRVLRLSSYSDKCPPNMAPSAAPRLTTGIVGSIMMSSRSDIQWRQAQASGNGGIVSGDGCHWVGTAFGWLFDSMFAVIGLELVG